MNLPDFFGIDLGSQSLKIAQIKRNDNTAELVALGSLATKLNPATANDEISKKKLAEAIKRLRDEAKINTKSVVTALPESLLFTRLIYLPDLPEDKIEQSLFYEAKQYLPIPPDEVQLDYIPISKKSDGNKTVVQTLLVAAPKITVAKYTDIFEKAGLDLIGIETETVASARAISFNNISSENVMLVDFGATNTDLSIIKGKYPIFSQSLATGSIALTRAIATDFGLDFNLAEQYKKTYGLLKNQAEGRIAESLDPFMQLIINEINKTLNYFKGHLQESSPSKIYIVGDGANLPGIAEFLTENLGIYSEVRNPLSSISISNNIKSEVAQYSTLGFSVCIGLALKNE